MPPEFFPPPGIIWLRNTACSSECCLCRFKISFPQDAPALLEPTLPQVCEEHSCHSSVDIEPNTGWLRGRLWQAGLLHKGFILYVSDGYPESTGPGPFTGTHYCPPLSLDICPPRSGRGQPLSLAPICYLLLGLPQRKWPWAWWPNPRSNWVISQGLQPGGSFPSLSSRTHLPRSYFSVLWLTFYKDEWQWEISFLQEKPNPTHKDMILPFDL